MNIYESNKGHIITVMFVEQNFCHCLVIEQVLKRFLKINEDKDIIIRGLFQISIAINDLKWNQDL